MAEEITTPDGVLAHDPECESGLALAWPTHILGREFTHRVVGRDETIELVGRSALLQTGVELWMDTAPHIKNNRANSVLYVPVGLTSHDEIGEQIEEDILEIHRRTPPGKSLRWKTRPLKVGGVVDCSRLTPELCRLLHL